MAKKADESVMGYEPPDPAKWITNSAIATMRPASPRFSVTIRIVAHQAVAMRISRTARQPPLGVVDILPTAKAGELYSEYWWGFPVSLLGLPASLRLACSWAVQLSSGSYGLSTGSHRKPCG